MPALLMYDHGNWSRHVLGSPTGSAILRPAAAPSITAGDGRAASIPPDAAGMILCCEGQPYYLASPGATTYLNAEPRPVMPLHRLHDRDRLTYCGCDGRSTRVWYLQQDDRPQRRYEGPPGQMCGYCSMTFALGEEIMACAGCGEMVHTDCLAHGGGACPRCGLELTHDEAPWLPEGFPDEITEDDEDWD
jgi:hypothetical protein